MDPNVQSPPPVQQSSLKTFRQNHPIFLALIISFLLYLISSNVFGRVPGLAFFHMIIVWFGIPIYLIKTIYHSVTGNKVSSPVGGVIENQPEDSVTINNKQSKLALILLALELPLLLVSFYVYFSNGWSHYGDAGVLVYVFGLTLFIPNLIAFVIFGSGYIKGLIKNWKQLSKYNIANFILLGIQLYLYLTLISYF